jgi:hypothetical protein
MFLAPSTARAEGVIKQPGQHNQYSFELEPQLAISWWDYGWYGRCPGCRYGGWGGGIGPGIRASIPFMHNGPIDTINNNIGINFGIDTLFYGSGGLGIHAPVSFQWNFYFTEIISVLGEVGLSLNSYHFDGGSWFAPGFVAQGGGRFQFGKVGVLVRIGVPMFTVGANIQF